MMNSWGMGGGGILLWLLLAGLALLVVAAVVALIVWAIMRSQKSSGGAPGKEGAALTVLQERYARGEITRDQYEEMRRDLMS